MRKDIVEEIILEIKCAHCFKQLVVHDPERKHLCFCSDDCRMKGRSFPDEKTMKNRKSVDRWRKINVDRTRAIALASYHRRKKLTGRPVGRPRKQTSVDKLVKSI